VFLTAATGATFEALARWIPGFDPATGAFALPAWLVAAVAVVAAALLLLVAVRCARLLIRGLVAGGRWLLAGARRLRTDGLSEPLRPNLNRWVPTGAVVLRVALVLAGAGAAWFIVDGWTRRELAAERRMLDARAFELTTRALMPGSALACLDAGAGGMVEASCEKALFATPEATAAAVTYVAAQLALLTDGTAFVRRDRSYAETLSHLRRAVENDRFGLVAHALAVRDGCTPERCRAFALLDDAGRVRANLADRSYDFYVVRHASGWPPIAKAPGASTTSPVAMVAPRAPAAAPAAAATASGATVALPASVPAEAANAQASARPPAAKPPGPNVFFPSAASIPPVSIMDAEPTTPAPPRAAPTAAAAPAATPTPPRRPSAAQQPTSPPRRPAESNAAAARPEPPATTQ